MKKPKLYKTPIIIAWVLLIVGLLGVFNLLWLPLLMSGFNGMDGGFAFIMIGILLSITAIVMFYYFRRLNSDFTKMLTGASLLTYVMPTELYRAFSEQEAEDIKSKNSALLFIIYAFSVLLGVILSLAVDPLFILIFLGIDVFFTAVHFITTAYRTKKVRRSQALVSLSEGGVYAYGNMHSWSVPGARLTSIAYGTEPAKTLPCPCISLTYMAVAYPAPRHETVTIPVPSSLSTQAAQAVEVIRNANKLSFQQ